MCLFVCCHSNKPTVYPALHRILLSVLVCPHPLFLFPPFVAYFTHAHTHLSLLFPEHVLSQVGKASLSALLVGALSVSPVLAATDSGASSGANAKITTGGASTLQSGRTIAITRGVNLDNSDFAGQNLRGVAFQQSIVRNADFKGSNLVGASFFDATLDGTNFEDAGT